MGVFCPFCGVVAKEFKNVIGHDDPLDMHLLGDDGGDWISDVHLIGVNKNSRSVDKAYITGLAVFRDYGWFHVDVGDHPNCPSDYRSLANGKVRLRTYALEDDDPATFPYHQVCFMHMFSRVLHWACKDLDGTGDYGIWRNFDLETLHTSLSSLWRGGGHLKLSLDYGAISDRQDQFVQYCKGDEEFAANPISGAAVSQYFSKLPRLEQSNAHGARLSLDRQEPGPHSDRLSTLPLELLNQILLYLPPRDVQSLRALSRAIHSLTLSNEYWFQRIAIDLPFLFDRPRRNDLEATQVIDWRQVHKDVSNMSSHESTSRVVGLISRRRIWMVCEKIVDVYLDYVRNSQNASMPEMNEFIGEVVSPRVPRVAWPNIPDHTPFRKFLYNDFDSMVPARTVITAYWNDRCLLGNVRFSTDDKVIDLINPKLLADNLHSDSFDLTDADWIESLELILADVKSSDSSLTQGGIVGITFHTSGSQVYQVGITDVSKSDGVTIQSVPYRRLLKTSRGHFLVGLQGDTADGTIHRLGILEQKVNTNSVPRVDTTQAIQQYMWLGCAPGDQTMLSKLQYGYWSSELPLETTAMEIGLQLGPSEKAASIAGDVMLGGFELVCLPQGTGPVRVAGPKRQAMKSLTLDWEKGERVVHVETQTGHLPRMIRFITNQGRQLILGWPDGRNGTVLHSPEDGYVTSGVFCSWNYSSRAELTTFGVMFAPSHHVLEERVEPSPQLLDSGGRYWEPCSPPPGWLEDGPIIEAGGDREAVRPRRIKPRTAREATLVSWLDFRRALETIRLWFSHPYGFEKDLSLVGIVFEYSDGSCSSVGVDSEAHSIQSQKKYECPCRSYAKQLPDAEWPSEHHWYSESWHPDGEPITGVRLWSGLALEGIQFMPKVGPESPIWGKCNGIRHEIMFGGSDACGLKLFLGSNHRPASAYEDMVIVAVQALKGSSAEGRPS